MAWSTRQVADLAGTTLRAVRHYHEIGLLPEPGRRSNGYKQYGVTHLVRLLQIRNLVDLGFSLAEIENMDDSARSTTKILDRIDRDLASTIERLTQAREQIAQLGGSPDSAVTLGSALRPMANHPLSEQDQGFLAVYGQLAGEEAVSGYLDAVTETRDDPVLREFENLPQDADEDTRVLLAERLAEYQAHASAAHPELDTAGAAGPVGRKRAGEAIGRAIAELYNSAQVDVIVRASALRDS